MQSVKPTKLAQWQQFWEGKREKGGGERKARRRGPGDDDVHDEDVPQVGHLGEVLEARRVAHAAGQLFGDFDEEGRAVGALGGRLDHEDGLLRRQALLDQAVGDPRVVHLRTFGDENVKKRKGSSFSLATPVSFIR